MWQKSQESYSIYKLAIINLILFQIYTSQCWIPISKFRLCPLNCEFVSCNSDFIWALALYFTIMNLLFHILYYYLSVVLLIKKLGNPCFNVTYFCLVCYINPNEFFSESCHWRLLAASQPGRVSCYRKSRWLFFSDSSLHCGIWCQCIALQLHSDQIQLGSNSTNHAPEQEEAKTGYQHPREHQQPRQRGEHRGRRGPPERTSAASANYALAEAANGENESQHDHRDDHNNDSDNHTSTNHSTNLNYRPLVWPVVWAGQRNHSGL